jgi:hypothetical protein
MEEHLFRTLAAQQGGIRAARKDFTREPPRVRSPGACAAASAGLICEKGFLLVHSARGFTPGSSYARAGLGRGGSERGGRTLVGPAVRAARD